MKRTINHSIICFSLLMIFCAAVEETSAQRRKTTTPAPVSAPQKSVSADDSPTTAPTTEAAPMQNSKSKICVAAPKTNLLPAETAAVSLENSLVKYLSGPAAEIERLEAMVAVQQRAEAAQKNCGYYLLVSVQQKKSGGGECFGGMLKKASNATPLLTDLGAGRTAQTISNTARKSQTKLTTASDLAVGIKAKDEVTLEYALFDARSNASAASGKLKAKANKDGEDILSGLLEQSVSDVLTVAVKN